MISSDVWKYFFDEYKHIIVAFILILMMPLAIPIPTATEMIIYGLYAMGFNIALGFTGMLSFGHAAFFGLGTYGAAIALRYFNSSVWTAILAGAVLAALGAFFIGALCVKKRGVYFALLIAAFGQMFYFLALSPLKHITGGEDGLKEIPILSIEFPFFIDLAKPFPLFLFTFFIVAVSVLLMHRFLNSPFGALMQGIRENETRLQACGYSVLFIKIIAFTVSGLFSGLAGALSTVYLGYGNLGSLYWLTSGRGVVMTLLGGMNSFFGPFLGAGIFIYFEDTISVMTARWEVFVGTMVILLILAFPDGILGTLEKRFRKTRKAETSIAQAIGNR